MTQVNGTWWLLARAPVAGLVAAALVGTVGCGGDLAAGDQAGGSNVGFGGAQDIGQFRDILERGEIPGPATLDANGFFSEHVAELPPPDCGDDLCLHAMLAVGREWVQSRRYAALQLAFNSPLTDADIQGRPRDFVVVVDTSGSMSLDGRLEQVKQGLHLLADGLGDGDRIALIRYGSDAKVVMELGTPGPELDELIDGLQPSGSTNLSGGLELGFQTMAAAASDPGREQRVILLSDGLANVGLVYTPDIVAMAESYIRDGVGLTTIGVGDEFNVDLMKGLAEQGSGNFYFVEDAAAVSEVFQDELDFFSVPVAFDLHIEVDGTSAYDIGRVVGSSQWTSTGESGAVDVPSLFLASRHSGDPGSGGRRGGGSALFIELVPRPGVQGPAQAATVRISYRLPDGQMIERTQTVDDPYVGTDPPAGGYYSTELMREHYGMYNMYLGLRVATEAATVSYDCAHATLAVLRRNALEWNSEMMDPDIASDLELVDEFLANLEERGAVAGEEMLASVCAYVDPWQANWYYGENGYTGMYACAAAGSPATDWWPVLLALGGVALAGRRRRRASITLRA